MVRIKLNNQNGFTFITTMLAIAFNMFFFVMMFYLFSNMKSSDLEQQRYNNFMADKDAFYLNLGDALLKANSVNIENGGIISETYGTYDAQKEVTTLTTTAVYQDGLEQIQERYVFTDKGDYVTSTKTLHAIKKDPTTGKTVLEPKKSKSEVYPSLTDLYAKEINEICYDDTTGNAKCQSVSNLLDIVIYSSGVSGKSPEFPSRRLMYYAEK